MAISYLSKAAINEDPQDETCRRQSTKTVAGLCAAYIEQHSKKKRIWWKNDESCLRRYVLPKLRFRMTTTIVPADIEAIHSEIGTQHPYAGNHLLEVVRSMYNLGKVAGIVPQNYPSPIHGINWFPERAARATERCSDGKVKGRPSLASQITPTSSADSNLADRYRGWESRCGAFLNGQA